LGVDSTSRGWQSQVAIGLAAIVAGLVALLLTVGLAAVQLRASLSWKTLQGIVDARARLGLLLIVGIGVGLPLWVALVPSPFWTRWAFAGFGWALLLAAAMVWVGMKRTAPEWLVNRAVRAGTWAVVRRSIRTWGGLPDCTDVLVELAGHPALGPGERRRVLATVALTLTAQGRNPDHRARTAAAVDRLVQPSLDGVLAPSSVEDVVTVLVVLGSTLRERDSVHAVIRSALAGIAQRARAGGHRTVGVEALDGLAQVTIERLSYLIPDQLLPELVGDVQPDVDDESLSREPILRPLRRRRADAQSRLQVAAAQRRLSQSDLAKMVDVVLLSELDSEIPRREDAYDLMEEVGGLMMGLLGSPRPGAQDWPGGWQGQSALANDVRRIGRLSQWLYRQHRYSTADTAEQALETVGMILLAFPVPVISTPPDRTRWRDAHDASSDDPLAAVGETLAELMVDAFEAGFDRRALLTGRRLLALITSAARSEQAGAAATLERSLHHALLRITRRGRETRLADQLREEALCLGLIAELDSLLAACAGDSKLKGVIDGIVNTLVWQTNSLPVPLAVAVWRSQLVGAGWVEQTATGAYPVRKTSPEPLPNELVRWAANQLDSGVLFPRRDPRLTAALISSLWANAVAVSRSGDSDIPDGGLRRLFAKWRDEFAHELDEHGRLVDRDINISELNKVAVEVSLHRLAAAAMRWLRGSHSVRPSFPQSAVPHTEQLRAILTPELFVDRTYRGIRACGALVIVEEQDKSRRLLRDEECRARGEFEWGYSGTGPATLAEVMSLDILGRYARCAACLGGSLYTAGIVWCSECRSTGLTPAVSKLEALISERLEEPRKGVPADSTTEWSYTRRELLEDAVRSLCHSDRQHDEQ
jgi:hypothetical protein